MNDKKLATGDASSNAADNQQIPLSTVKDLLKKQREICGQEARKFIPSQTTGEIIFYKIFKAPEPPLPTGSLTKEEKQ